jgi:hypothetical protein
MHFFLGKVGYSKYYGYVTRLEFKLSDKISRHAYSYTQSPPYFGKVRWLPGAGDVCRKVGEHKPMFEPITR